MGRGEGCHQKNQAFLMCFGPFLFSTAKVLQLCHLSIHHQDHKWLLPGCPYPTGIKTAIIRPLSQRSILEPDPPTKRSTVFYFIQGSGKKKKTQKTLLQFPLLVANSHRYHLPGGDGWNTISYRYTYKTEAILIGTSALPFHHHQNKSHRCWFLSAVFDW